MNKEDDDKSNSEWSQFALSHLLGAVQFVHGYAIGVTKLFTLEDIFSVIVEQEG